MSPSTASWPRRVADLGGETALLDDLIELRQRPLERLRLVGDLELEERLLLDELARALGILDAGNLDDDAIVALLLHDRLRDAESLDTRAHGLQRAIDRFGLLVGGIACLESSTSSARYMPPESRVRAAAERAATVTSCSTPSLPRSRMRDVAREQEAQTETQTEADDDQYAILQGHTTAGRR